MYGENQPEMQCTEFEALLAEALDGTLTGAKREAFDRHHAVCSHCAPLYEEAEAGLRWLEVLKAEAVEPPARLLDNILKATSWAQLPAREAGKPWWQRLRETPLLAPVFSTVLQPRFAVAFAMAFFSASVLLNLSGLKLRDVRYLDLRPSAIVRTVYETQGRIVKYYENIRFVYEIESRVRDLKRVAAPEEPAPQPEQPKPQPNNRTGQPEPEKYRNYSRDEARPLVATFSGAIGEPGPPVRAWARAGAEDRRSL